MHSSGSCLASRPCACTALRESIVVNHRADQATGVSLQMSENAFSHCRPRLDSSAAVALAGVSNNAGTNLIVSKWIEMGGQDLFHKTLFSLVLNVDEQPGHVSVLRLLMRRAATNFILLPQLAEAVIIQPVLQAVLIEATELRLPVHAVSHEHIFRLEMIEKK